MAGGRKAIVGQRSANVTRPRFDPRVRVTPNRPPQAGTGPAVFHFNNAHTVAQNQIRQAADAAAEAYNDVLVDFFNTYVVKVWPVATGYSRAMLQVVAKPVGETLVMSIQNKATYAAYIRQNKYRVPNAAKRILWDKMKRIGDDMMARLGHLIAKG